MLPPGTMTAYPTLALLATWPLHTRGPLLLLEQGTLTAPEALKAMSRKRETGTSMKKALAPVTYHTSLRRKVPTRQQETGCDVCA